MKTCYDEVWTILEERRAALRAGVDALSSAKEMLGGELRDVFDAHPPEPLSADGGKGSNAQPGLHGMRIYTAGRDDAWPYGIEWLDDTYPTPYWVRKAREEKEAAAAAAAAGGGGGGGGDGGAPVR